MKVCISPQSLKLFAAYFNKNIPDIVKSNKSYNQIIKELYNKALSDLKISAGQLTAGDFSLEELVVQHMTIVPQLLLTEYGKNPMNIGYSLMLEVLNKNNDILDATQNDQESAFASVVNRMAESLDLIEKQAPIGASVVGRWEAVRLPLYALINQEATWDEEKATYKGNQLTDPKKIFTAKVQRNIINGGNISNYRLKMIKTSDVVNDPDAVFGFDANEMTKVGSYVLVLVDKSNQIVKFNDDGSYSPTGKFPILNIKNSPFQFDYQRKNYVQSEIAKGKSKEQAENEFDANIKDYFAWLDASTNKVKDNQDVFFNIDLAESSSGNIERNTKMQTNLSEVKNINDLSFELKITAASRNAAIRIPGYLTAIPIYEKPFETLEQKDIDFFIELLTNNSLFYKGRSLTQADRNSMILSYMPTFKVGATERVPFQVTMNKVTGQVEKVFLNGQGYTISGSKVSEQKKAENKQRFVEAFTQFISSYHLVPVSASFPRPNNYTPLEGTAEEVLANVTSQQEYVIVNGTPMLAMKPTVSQGLFPSISSIDTGSIYRVTGISGKNLSVETIPLKDYMIDNMFTDVVVNDSKELHSYFPYIAFKPEVTAEDIDAKLGAIKWQSLNTPVREDNILSALNWTEETLAMDWLKDSGWLSVLRLVMTGKEHSKGPQFVASFMHNTISLFKGSNLTDAYHEVFHAYFDGLLTQEERNGVYNELRSKNKGASFSVTVAGVQKNISFADATELELEEFLAEEFRRYARSKSIYNKKQKNTKVGRFFAKLWELLNKMFGRRTYAEVVGLNFVSEDVQTLLKNLYESKDAKGNSLTFSDYITPKSNHEKFQSLDVDYNKIEMTNAELQKAMTAMSALYVRFIDAVVNPSYANKQTKDLAVKAFLDVARTQPGREGYEDTLRNRQLAFAKLRDLSDGHSGVNTMGLQTDSFMLISALEYMKLRLEQIRSGKKQAQLNPGTESITNKEDIEMLDKLLKNFGDFSLISGTEGFGAIKGANDSMMAIFLNNFTPLGLDNIADSELEIEALANDPDRDLDTTWDLERKAPFLEKDLDIYTTFLLSTLTQYEDSGRSSKEKESSLGLPQMLPLKVALVKVANAIANKGTTEESMYDALVKAAETDFTLIQLIERLGNPRNPNITAFEVEQWGQFLRSMNKATIKPIFYAIEKIDNEKEGESKLEGKLGKTHNKTSFQLKNWGFAFQNNIMDSTDKLDSVYGTQITAEGDFVFGLSPQAFSDKWRSVEGGRQRYLMDPVGMLNDLGMNLSKSAIIQEALLKGNTEYGIKPESLLYILESIEHRINAVNESDRIVTSFRQLSSSFSYKNANGSVVQQENLNTYYKELANFSLLVDENSMSFSEFNAEGERISTKNLHSSLSIEIITLNNAKSYNELISIPGMEHYNYEVNPESVANLTFVQMFRLYLPVNHPDYGRRNNDISITLETITGVQVIHAGKEKGVSSIKSDEKTKFNTDFAATLRNRQETLRSEAKSTSPIVHMPILKKGETVVRSGLWINNNEANEIFSDNYSGTYLFDVFKNQIESELVRMFRLQEVQKRIDDGETVLFDKAFLDRGKDWFKFDLLLSRDVKERLLNLKVSDSFTLEEVIKSDPKLIADVEKDLVDYFAYRADALYTEKNKSLVLTDGLFKEYQIEDESEYSTRMRMFRVFTLNNYLQNLNYASTFLGDPANYNVAALAFHKRIAGKIGTGRLMRHSQMWYDFVNSDKFERDGHSKKYFSSLTEAEKEERNLVSQYQERKYSGHLRTAILQEAKTNSIYRQHYNKLLGIPEDKYSDMKEGDGAAYVSFDTYRLLAKSHQEWSPQQEALYQRMLVDDNINELEMSATFPVRKYQYYGPVFSEDISAHVSGLTLMAFHKYSVIPLVPTLIKDTPLQQVHEMMMEQGIDYVTFKTGSKLSDISRINSEGTKYDAPYKIEEIDGAEQRSIDRSIDFTVNTIHVRHLKSVVQMSEGYHGTSLLPSQMRKLILTGLFDENAVPTDYTGRKKWTNLSYAEQLKASNNFRWSQEYTTTIDEMIELAKEDLLEDLGLSRLVGEGGVLSFSGGTQKFAAYLREQLANKQLTSEEIDFIYDKETKELIPDLSLSLNASKIEEVLIKLADDSLRRMEFTGEALVQMPGTMLEDFKPTLATEDEVFAYGNNGLSTYYGVKEDGTVATEKDGIAYIKSMEVKIALQGGFKKLLHLDFKGESIMQYRLIIDENTMQVTEAVDFNASIDRLNEAMLDQEWRALYKDFITIPATRIPTSQFSMLESATVKQFLRPSAGPIIILPSEIVAKSGSDFDIDKLFALFSNIVSVKGKVQLATYIPGIKETRYQLAEQVDANRKEVDLIRDRINKLYDNKEDIFNNKEENKSKINEKLQSISDVIIDLRTQRKALREEAKAVYEGKGKFVGWTEKQKYEYHHGEDGSVFKLKVLNDRIDYYIKERSREWGAELDALYAPFNLQIEKEEKRLAFAESRLELSQSRLYGKSVKAIQNKIVSLMNERITDKNMFGRLVEPNSTDFFDDLASEMEGVLSKQYNKYNSANVDDMRNKASVVTKTIANSTIFDYRYNLSVHQENSRGLQALGVAAVTSTYYALFTQFGATLKGLSANDQALYNRYLYIVSNKEEFTNSEINKAAAELSKFKNYTIKFPHQSKGTSVSLGFINNIEGRPIQDVIGQLINGFVDVATKPWVFNVQGNMENVPQMLLMVMAGMKVEDVVYFASTPLVLEYNTLKAEMKGAFSNLSSVFGEEAFINSSDVIGEARKIMQEKYQDQLSVPSGVTNLNKFMANAVDNSVVEKDGYLKSKVQELVDENTINEHYGLFAHYLQIEDMAQDFTNFTMATKFDTKKPQSLTEYQDRIETIQNLKESSSSIPITWFDKILGTDANNVRGSILGSFNQDQFIVDFIKDRFLIRNHPYLMKKSLSLQKPKGVKKEMAFVAFKDDFAFYLYQNSFFKNNMYDNYKFIEDSSLAVIIDVRENDVYFNREMVESAAANLNLSVGEFFPTAQHYLRYRVELEKVEAEFSQMQPILNASGEVIKTVPQQIKEKYYYLKTTGTANTSIADIKMKLSLWKSKNNVAYFDYRMGIMTMLDLMKKKHPDLVDRFKLIQDLNTQYDTDTKKANFFINDLEDPMLVAVYKENLASLKNSEYPEVAELFQMFDHIAMMQAGASGTGMTNLGRIIDQNKFYDFIETSIGTNEILRELDAGMESYNKGIKLASIQVPILDSFVSLFNNQIKNNWSSRKRGINLMVDSFDTAGAGQEVNRLSTLNVKVYTKFEGIEIPYPKLTINNLLIDTDNPTASEIDVNSKTLALNMDFIESVKEGIVAVINGKILSVEDSVVQKKLNDVLKTYFGIDNTGDKLIAGRRSIYTGSNLTIALSDKLINKHSETDEMMANQSSLAIGKETENISRPSASTYYTEEINRRFPDKMVSKATKFKATDTIWIYGSGLFESAYAGKMSKSEWETAVQTDFNKNYIPLINKAIKGGVRTFYIGTATGIDEMATKYLKDNGYYAVPRYHSTGKYFQFVKMDEQTPNNFDGIIPGSPSIMLGNDLGFNFIGDATVKDEVNAMSANELASGIGYEKVKASVYSKLAANKISIGPLITNLISTVGSPLVADKGLGFGVYLQYVEQVMSELRAEMFNKRMGSATADQSRRIKNLLEANMGMAMNFKDGQEYKDVNGNWSYARMQAKFAGKSTFDLILSGDRTRTTRSQTEMDRLLNLYKLRNPQELVGLIVPVTESLSSGTRKAYVQITKVADFTQEYQNATWEKEGWEKDVTDRHVGNYPYAIEFSFVSNNTISEETIRNLKNLC